MSGVSCDTELVVSGVSCDTELVVSGVSCDRVGCVWGEL